MSTSGKGSFRSWLSDKVFDLVINPISTEVLADQILAELKSRLPKEIASDPEHSSEGENAYNQALKNVQKALFGSDETK